MLWPNYTCVTHALKGSSCDATHICDQTFSDCMSSTPCLSVGIRIPCAERNRSFRSQTSFDNHKKKRGNKRLSMNVRDIAVCGGPIVPRRVHVCNKGYCETCKQNRDRIYLLYVTTEERVAIQRQSTVRILRFRNDSEYPVCLYGRSAPSKSGVLTTVLFVMRDLERF